MAAGELGDLMVDGEIDLEREGGKVGRGGAQQLLEAVVEHHERIAEPILVGIAFERPHPGLVAAEAGEGAVPGSLQLCQREGRG